jgi:hypothetical protein
MGPGCENVLAAATALVLNLRHSVDGMHNLQLKDI